MAKEEMKDLTFHIGKLTSAVESLDANTKTNTAEIKVFNAYMHKNIGATEEREKHYKRVKHTAIGSIIVACGTLIRTFIH